MTPEEFKNLKTGTADPLSPEKVLATALWRLEEWQKMKKTGHDWFGRPVKAQDLEEFNKNMNNRIDAVCCVLSVHLKEDGSIEPTHFYG